MILPTKHIRLSNSLLGAGATLIECLEEETTVTSLWGKTKALPNVRAFDRFTLALDLLFLLDLVEFDRGLIRRIPR